MDVNLTLSYEEYDLLKDILRTENENVEYTEEDLAETFQALLEKMRVS